MKALILPILIMLTAPSLRAQGNASQLLADNLKDLYVTHLPRTEGSVEDDRKLEIVVTMNSYQGDLGLAAIIKNDYKYTVYVANEELEVLRTFDFFFGGPSQYAVWTSDESEVLVGRVGEYVEALWFEAYAGLRSDPVFYDKEGYRTFIEDQCEPESGFRCVGEGDVENYFQNKNVLAIALSMRAKDIISTDADNIVPTKFYVWAKAFKKQ